MDKPILPTSPELTAVSSPALSERRAAVTVGDQVAESRHEPNERRERRESGDGEPAPVEPVAGADDRRAEVEVEDENQCEHDDVRGVGADPTSRRS